MKLSEILSEKVGRDATLYYLTGGNIFRYKGQIISVGSDYVEIYDDKLAASKILKLAYITDYTIYPSKKNKGGAAA